MVGTALLVGSAFGIRHAFEADHVAAVATLVEDEAHPASTGAAWGVGHSMPILLLGAVFLALDLRIPSSVTTVFEVIVAVILVALGTRVIAGREAIGTAILRHIHGDDDTNAEGEHLHLAIGRKEIGLTHSHADEESFTVGIVHGLAGSGGIVIALAAAAPTIVDGAAFLVAFSSATVVTMGLAAGGWGRLIGRAGALRIAAGVASVGVGMLLFAEIAGFAVPL